MNAAASPAIASDRDELQQTLDDVRCRFVDGFVGQCETIRRLLDEVATLGAEGPVVTLAEVVHRLSGLAGTIGFPTVSARAAELETLLSGASPGVFDVLLARSVVEAVSAAFTSDLQTPPEKMVPSLSPVQGATILVIEDEADLRAIVVGCLTSAGYVPTAVSSGDSVLAVARAERPALILLDVQMPGLDGYAVCRQLKADPALADIPVIFMTTGATLDERLAGFALGAEEFLGKPVDLRELLMRVQLLLQRCRPRDSAMPSSRELSYDVFLARARTEIGRGVPTALAIVRLPSERHDEAVRLLGEELRGRDLIGTYCPTHLLILMPDMTAVAARDRLESAVDHLVAQGLHGICVGVTASLPAEGKTEDVLLSEADEALAEARYLGRKVVTWSERPAERVPGVPATRVVVVAEDDPDMARIVDAQVRAAGFKVIVAFDGEEALAAVRAHAPDVLVLDLMMPKLHGFGVLMQIHDGPAPWPRTVVLSGHGREQDVVRAFELGADDYITKPFNLQELTVRIARLLK